MPGKKLQAKEPTGSKRLTPLKKNIDYKSLFSASIIKIEIKLVVVKEFPDYEWEEIDHVTLMQYNNRPNKIPKQNKSSVAVSPLSLSNSHTYLRQLL